jgi:copper ion binding protein
MSKQTTLKIAGMSCGHCVMHVTKALKSLEGVEVGDVQIGSATVTFDPAKTSESRIAEAVRKAGYEVLG